MINKTQTEHEFVEQLTKSFSKHFKVLFSFRLVIKLFFHLVKNGNQMKLMDFIMITMLNF